MKSCQDDFASYREQCQILKEEKAVLTKNMQDLENEISRMKNELESLSIHSKLSQQTRHSQSCGSLYSVDRMDKDFEVRIIDELYIEHVM